jgi:hypothetical protein
VFRNTQRQPDKPQLAPADANFLRISLEGKAPNKDALHSQLWVYLPDGSLRYHLYTPYRGYNSSSELTAHFGLGTNASADSVRVRWPDGRSQLLRNVTANQVLRISYNEAQTYPTPPIASPSPLLLAANDELRLQFRHQELDFVDFNIQKTLPRKFSRMGPALAVADVNGDGLDDFIVGGAFRYDATLFLQQADGSFQERNPFRTDGKVQQYASPMEAHSQSSKDSEDAALLFIDFNNDGLPDLYIASGSYELQQQSPALQDRIYLNKGNGYFEALPNALPAMLTASSCVKAADFDGDGDLDLFVGGLVVPGRYPETPRSYLLRNDSKQENGQWQIRFSDITADAAPELLHPGMIKDALWSDVNSNGQPDLILVGEWMSPRIFLNENGQLRDVSTQIDVAGRKLSDFTGWWNSISAVDIDGDGDTDYVLGNLGLNTMFKGTFEEPLHLLAKDFDNNGSYDPFIGCFGQDSTGQRILYPMHARDDMIKQMLPFRRRYQRYADYGDATFATLFTEEELQGAQQLKAHWMASSLLINEGKGEFSLKALPVEAQLAPVYGTATYDVNSDGWPDLMLLGNDYGMETFSGRLNGLNGLVLLNQQGSGLRALNPGQGGLVVPGDARALAQLQSAQGHSLWLASQNGGKLLAFKASTPAKGQWVQAQPGEVAILIKRGEKLFKKELYTGDGYFSQSSAKHFVSADVTEIIWLKADGSKRQQSFTIR